VEKNQPKVAVADALGQLGNPEERELPLLEARTGRLVKTVTEDTSVRVLACA
jgi:hypothetical protein